MSAWRGRGVKSTRPSLPFRQGHIVWAPIIPDGGAVKQRRSVVLSTDEQIAAAGRILVVGVTATYDPTNTELFIEMPYAADGTCCTTFDVPCAAKATWVQDFAIETIRATTGYLRDDDFDRLIVKLNAYAAKLRELRRRFPPN